MLAGVGGGDGRRGDPFIDDLDAALLDDILEQHAPYRPSECRAPAGKTSFGFDFPGTNSDSDWNAEYAPFEASLFQAMLAHVDEDAGDGGGGGKDKSWTVRIGSGGNIYSHFAPNMHGEVVPPQRNVKSPWVDEVQQTVSVALELNQNPNHPQYCGEKKKNDDDDDANECYEYYLHQAGAYQKDDNYTTSLPFYSPSLARYCSGNSCSFVSWGTSAHVATPFTSPIMYINRYTDCDNGIIEHTQMIHNFANPNDVLSTPMNVDQTYANIGWGGVRTSTLPYALEPNNITGILEYSDVNNVDYLDLCTFGEPPMGKAMISDLKQLGGYTTFVESGLYINQLNLPPILPPCRKPGVNCTISPATCMVETCNRTDIDAGFVRMELIVKAGKTTDCLAYTELYNDRYVQLRCIMHDVGFGITMPNPDTLLSSCAPWLELGLYNSRTGRGVNVAFLRHWSYFPSDGRLHFAVYTSNKTEAITIVDSMFDNTNSTTDLMIDMRPTRRILPEGSIHAPSISMPLNTTTITTTTTTTNYNPSTLNTFTFVYGKAEEYGTSTLPGNARRRIGSTEIGPMTRDYTVFTINWFGYAVRLVPGSSYVNRGYYFISELGNVEATANDLVEKTYATQINNEDWSPRMVGIYSSKDDGNDFTIVSSSSVRGNSTTCDNPLASLICSGTSTPSPGRVPFFYVKCGTSSTYFGTDPYHFTPPFGSRFPGHGNISNMVRSYVCDGMDISVRPDWKLMGFFNSSDTGCLSLVQARYNSEICVANETAVPSSSSPTTLTNAPTTTTTTTTTTTFPTIIATTSPTSRPLSSLTNAPSSAFPTSTTTSPTSRLSTMSTKPKSGAPTFAEKKKNKSISKSGKTEWQLKASKQIKSITIKFSPTTTTTTATSTTTKPTTKTTLYRERTRVHHHKVDSKHTRGKAILVSIDKLI